MIASDPLDAENSSRHRLPGLSEPRSGTGNGTWRARDIEFILISSLRQPRLLAKAIKSLVASDSEVSGSAGLTLGIDGSELPCKSFDLPEDSIGVGRFKQDYGISAKECPSRQARIHHALIACIQSLPAASAGICLIADDLQFRSCFLAKLLDTVNELAPHPGDPVILSGYSPHDLETSRGLKRGELWVELPPLWF